MATGQPLSELLELEDDWLASLAAAQAAKVEQWSRIEQLLATLVEVVDHGNRTFEQVHAKKGSQARKPIQIDRPGQRKGSTLADLAGLSGVQPQYVGGGA